jgi:hypothetical protein
LGLGIPPKKKKKNPNTSISPFLTKFPLCILLKKGVNSEMQKERKKRKEAN